MKYKREKAIKMLLLLLLLLWVIFLTYSIVTKNQLGIAITIFALIYFILIIFIKKLSKVINNLPEIRDI